MLASLINQGAAIWDVDSGNIISTEYGYDNQGLYVGSARFSPNGNHIVSTHGRDAKIWDDGETISLTGHKRYIYFSCFSPNGNLVATASDDGTAKLWEATTGKLMATLPHAHDVLHVDFSPDSKLLATACADFSAQIWQVQPTKLLHKLQAHSNDVFLTKFSPDGKLLATISNDNTVRIWEAASGKLIR
jgi:WD40 repeat protein